METTMSVRRLAPTLCRYIAALYNRALVPTSAATTHNLQIANVSWIEQADKYRLKENAVVDKSSRRTYRLIWDEVAWVHCAHSCTGHAWAHRRGMMQIRMSKGERHSPRRQSGARPLSMVRREAGVGACGPGRADGMCGDALGVPGGCHARSRSRRRVEVQEGGAGCRAGERV